MPMASVATRIVDVAGLVERNLGVSRARRKRAEHHRRAAALAADQFRDGIDLLGRERDDGRAARQPRELLLAREGELREPGPRKDVGAGQQLLHHRPHRRGAQHQGFLAPAPVEGAVGEDVAALEIGAELNFVDGEKRGVEVTRHGFDRRHPETRIGRLDLLLAGHERHLVRADPIRHLVVDLACEQAQRKPDHAGGMREHALDGEMGLAGIGGPEHGGHAGAARAEPRACDRRGGRAKRKRWASGVWAANGEKRLMYESRVSRGRPGPQRFARCCSVSEYNTLAMPVIKLWNEFGTNRGRIAELDRQSRVRSHRHLAPSSQVATTSCG